MANLAIPPFLRALPLTVYLVAGALAFGGGWFALNNAHQRQLGAERILTAQARARGDSAARRADSLAKAYKPQAVAAVKWRTRWDSTGLRQLQATLDSLNAAGTPKPETVTVKVPVQVLVTAGSAVRSCTQALLTCEQRVGAERQRTEAAQADAKLAWRQVPSKLAPWRDRAVGGAVVLITLKLTGWLK